MGKMTPLLLAGSIIVAAAVAPAAQTQAPRFDAASVKRNTSGSENGGRNLGAGGRLVFENMDLRPIIAAAYGIEGYQLIGGPAWLSSERFDITATAGTNAPLEQLNRMLRTRWPGISRRDLVGTSTCRSTASGSRWSNADLI